MALPLRAGRATALLHQAAASSPSADGKVSMWPGPPFYLVLIITTAGNETATTATLAIFSTLPFGLKGVLNLQFSVR